MTTKTVLMRTKVGQAQIAPNKADTESRNRPDVSDLSPEQAYALQKFVQGESLFISGPGGSGKSHLIKRMTMMGKEGVQVTSTTGCSSVLLSTSIGVGLVKTINSWAGVKLCKGDPQVIIQSVLKNRYSVQAWRKVRCLIVDEVSMLSKKMFDVLETLGRLTRRNNRPFGGIQVVLVGDMFQLAPIPDPEDPASGQFCFESEHWTSVLPRANHVALTRIYRQKDQQFQDILNQVRVGELTKENADILRAQIDRTYDSAQSVAPIKILPTRSQVSHMNETEYGRIKEQEHVFNGRITTDCRMYVDSDKAIPQDLWSEGMNLSAQAKAFEVTALKSNTPVEECIKLKKGVPVMCLVNLDLENGIANGSLGVVVDVATNLFSENPIPVVQFSNGVTRNVGPYTWQHQSYPNICYAQLPLCLAYSSTIHKLQGSTLDLAEMNLGGSVFAEGQIYVGLSRVKSLEGLYLTAFHANKIRVNEKAKAFYATFPAVPGTTTPMT